jgi:methylated-DNA-[protein]-cysteine S-methyltransferase
MQYCYYASPVGRLLLAGDAEALRLIEFPGRERALPLDWCEDERPLRNTAQQLDEYFAGRRRTFDLPLAPEGTSFQQAVWSALQAIPYGQTISYGDLARRIRKPRAIRAVGAANGRNPIPIVIPCHRVIGADGSLTGFGGGLGVKRRLLALEGTLLPLD